MKLIEVKQVSKKYGDNVVLERLDFSVEAGEFCTMVGTSGCGKTTFLRMLLGEETPSGGQILLDGKPLPDEPGEDRGVVFQRYSVFPHLTVIDNVMLGAELKSSRWIGKSFGARRQEIRREAKELLDAVGLDHALSRYPAELSGGMQQRLAIAQALIMKPRVLLLDEPFGALDPGIRTDMHHLVLKLWRETGVTVFMITHDLKEGFSLGTRLMVFDKIRRDAQAPNAYGATITYDLPLKHADQSTQDSIASEVAQTSRLLAGAK
ncbi:MAG: ABC transporter ATP-binding protein [Alcanivoracaceae bacterium]|nr:ABC transporter ATP-binding protein [Alcanivoracaceae bacterium]